MKTKIQTQGYGSFVEKTNDVQILLIKNKTKNHRSIG